MSPCAKVDLGVTIASLAEIFIFAATPSGFVNPVAWPEPCGSWPVRCCLVSSHKQEKGQFQGCLFK